MLRTRQPQFEFYFTHATTRVSGAATKLQRDPRRDASSLFRTTSNISSFSSPSETCRLLLLQRWDELHTSENDPVGGLPREQMYAAFLVADGGVDLESFEVCCMDEARSILLQVQSPVLNVSAYHLAIAVL